MDRISNENGISSIFQYIKTPCWYFSYHPQAATRAPPKSHRNCQIRFTVVKGLFEVSCFLRGLFFPLPVRRSTPYRLLGNSRGKRLRGPETRKSLLSVKNRVNFRQKECETCLIIRRHLAAHSHTHEHVPVRFAVVCVCVSSRCVTGKVGKSEDFQAEKPSNRFWLRIKQRSISDASENPVQRQNFRSLRNFSEAACGKWYDLRNEIFRNEN